MVSSACVELPRGPFGLVFSLRNIKNITRQVGVSLPTLAENCQQCPPFCSGFHTKLLKTGDFAGVLLQEITFQQRKRIKDDYQRKSQYKFKKTKFSTSNWICGDAKNNEKCSNWKKCNRPRGLVQLNMCKCKSKNEKCSNWKMSPLVGAMPPQGGRTYQVSTWKSINPQFILYPRL